MKGKTLVFNQNTRNGKLKTWQNNTLKLVSKNSWSTNEIKFCSTFAVIIGEEQSVSKKIVHNSEKPSYDLLLPLARPSYQ